MAQFSTIDIFIIAGYFLATLTLGVIMTKKASTSMDHYFLGGRSIPWYLLGIAGMANWFDLTGTMIITSFLYMLGPRGLFIEFRGGAVLVLVFLISYTGKWHRRSGCMTAAEWTTYRFGTGATSNWMRFLKAFMTIVTTIGMLAYLVRGTSLFVGLFVPYPPMMVTAFLIAFSTIYTMLSGFYGIVLTDLLQGAIVLVACAIVSIMAYSAIESPEALIAVAESVTGNPDWIMSAPQWHTPMPEGYKMYESLILFAAFYLLRNMLCGLGTGDESKYFGAKSDRECSLQSMLQGVTVAFRWPMMMGFAVLGLFLVYELFPDQSSIAGVTALIKQFHPDVTAPYWHDLTSDIINKPNTFNPELISGLSSMLGESWQGKLPLVGFHGIVNPEQVLPAVMLNCIPVGLRGFIIVSMLAAMMSTLTGEVNKSAAQFVKDIYREFLRKTATNKELLIVSYISTAVIVLGGFCMGVAADSINSLWGWIIMSLTAGGLAPYVLRLYWWRCNAWGIAGGTILGGIGAVTQRFAYPDMSELYQFSIMTGLSFFGTVVFSLITKPTPMDTLVHFYRTTRPFGFWGPLKAKLTSEERKSWSKEHYNDIMCIPFLLITQVTAFLLPMQVVIHSWNYFFMTLPIFAIGIVGVYHYWWKNLPPANNPGTDCAFNDK
ncbi:MAG: sodium:solute symporter [Planctomycetes bacterium]|nr:sodium:solute symporter [Planctomycetota bacterium]